MSVVSGGLDILFADRNEISSFTPWRKVGWRHYAPSICLSTPYPNVEMLPERDALQQCLDITTPGDLKALYDTFFSPDPHCSRSCSLILYFVVAHVRAAYRSHAVEVAGSHYAISGSERLDVSLSTGSHDLEVQGDPSSSRNSTMWR